MATISERTKRQIVESEYQNKIVRDRNAEDRRRAQINEAICAGRPVAASRSGLVELDATQRAADSKKFLALVEEYETQHNVGRRDAMQAVQLEHPDLARAYRLDVPGYR